jgi:hypothetical protein
VLKQSVSKRVAIVVGLIALALFLVWVRAFWGSLKAYHEGEDRLRKGQIIAAVTHFDRAIHWYTPFNPFVEKSAQRLWEISTEAQKRGDPRLALIALRAIRRGFYSARSFYTPGKDWIDRAETRIAILLPLEGTNGALVGRGTMPTKNKTQDGKSSGPNVLWAIIMEIGFLGWIGSAVGLINSFQRRSKGPPAIPLTPFLWGALIVAFFTIWLIGMMKA